MNLLDQKRSAPSVNKENAIRLFIWTTKAMVMRAYSRTSALIEEVKTFQIETNTDNSILIGLFPAGGPVKRSRTRLWYGR